MRLLFGLLSYLFAAIAIVSGAAAFLFSAVESAVRMVPAQQETPKIAPRVQAWLDRNAEGLVYAEKERAEVVPPTGECSLAARPSPSMGPAFPEPDGDLSGYLMNLEDTKMHISGESLLVILVVGLIAGWLAGQIVQGTGFGIVGDVIIGIVGAFIGSWLLPQLGVHLGSGIVAAIANATIGALILLLIIRLVRGGAGWRGGWARRW
jgi:uncharacterized membrane protein YeaQ/YmgE (transglycosylase-associated protein family)